MYCFTKYDFSGPSTRYRYYQYIDLFREKNIELIILPLFTKHYLKSKSILSKTISAFYSYVKRIVKIIQLNNDGFVCIEYELFPFMPTFFERLLKVKGIKYVVEYDDAIFHKYDSPNNILVKFLLQNKIPWVIKNASLVITGSPYLTAYCKKLNGDVIEIPTSLSVKVYNSPKKNISSNEIVIGWIGSFTTSENILSILPALREVASKIPCKIHLVGFNKKLEPHLYGLPYKIIEWTSQDEVIQLSNFDIGIMPLTDTPFNRGKCGFKLIQYMAMGLPTISTPLEANLKINRTGKNLHADTNREWVDAVVQFYNNQAYFASVGAENYEIFKTYYSIEANFQILLNAYSKYQVV